MGRINLRSLIDEVLEMVKNKQNEDKKLRSDQELARTNMSWDDTPAGQAYWKDIRGRNTAIEVGKMQNAGQMDVTRENNAGQMARQALMEDTKRADDVRDYNLNLYKEKVNENVGRFNAQTLRQAAMTKQETAGSKEDPRSALFTALSQPGMTDEEAVRIKKMFDGIYGGGPPQGSSREFDMEVPQVRTPKKPAITMPTLPVRQPAPAAQSMEFASDDVLRKRKMADRNKVVEEQMFGPKKDKGFFSSLF